MRSDEENQAIRRGLNGSVRRSSSSQRDRNSRVVIGKTGIAASAGMEATDGGKGGGAEGEES